MTTITQKRALAAGGISVVLLAAYGLSRLAGPGTVAPDLEEPNVDTALATMAATASPALPTETQTASPTVTATATPLIAWEGWATPIHPDGEGTAVPYPLGDWGLGSDVIAILGSDHLPHRDTVNTDAFALVMTRAGATSVVSFPRDLYVFIPGWGMGRINSAWGIGGEQAVRDTIAYNFGIEIKHFVLVDMTGFIEFVNYLGGVTVTVSESVYDRCGDFEVNYLPGEYNMGGWQALCYARAREHTSDFDRIRRQADVMDALFRKTVLRLATDPAGTGWRIFQHFATSIQTDMGVDDVAAASLYAAFLPPENIFYYRLVPPLVTRWIKPSTGAYLLLPPPAECLRDLLARAQNLQPWEDLPDYCPAEE